MSLTPKQKAMIRWKDAEQDDALKRNPLKNYVEGCYHVTLNTRNEAPTCGYVAGDVEAADGSTEEPRVVLSEVGNSATISY